MKTLLHTVYLVMVDDCCQLVLTDVMQKLEKAPANLVAMMKEVSAGALSFTLALPAAYAGRSPDESQRQPCRTGIEYTVIKKEF